MAVTLSQLRQTCYDILRESGASSAYPASLMDLFLNDAQQNILSGRVVNPITKEEVRKWELYFQKADVFYNNLPSISLSQDTTIWATELFTSDTTWFPDEWALYIWGNIVTYWSKTATSFTECVDVKFAHLAWTGVSILHLLPDDYWSIINVIYKNKIKMQQKMFDDMFEDLNNYKWTPKNRTKAIGYYDQPYRIAPFYTIIDANYLLIFNYQDINAMIKVRYEKLFPEMDWSHNCAIPNDIYAKTTVPYIAVGQMLMNRWEEARASQIISYGISKLKEMYDYYNSTDFEKISWVHYLMWKGKINI